MIALIRVDERLIHGQVVVGWGRRLRIDRYVVVDDELSSSEWEQEIYRMGAGETEVEFATVARARAALADWDSDELSTALLVRDVEALCRLGRGGALAGRLVNLGGIYQGRGRRRCLSYVHLSEGEEARLRELECSEVRIEARDLPGTTPVALSALLG